MLASESDPVKVEQTLRAWVDRVMERFFQTETLWGGGEPVDETVLRERPNTAGAASDGGGGRDGDSACPVADEGARPVGEAHRQHWKPPRPRNRLRPKAGARAEAR